MSKPSGLSLSDSVHDYMLDICVALTEYVEDGGIVTLKSDRDGESLSIAFTLADGDRYHELLNERMATSYERGRDRIKERAAGDDGAREA